MELTPCEVATTEGFCWINLLPDEIIERIISFVPCKESCFLVNSTFKREATKTIQTRCSLKLVMVSLIKHFNLVSDNFHIITDPRRRNFCLTHGNQSSF